MLWKEITIGFLLAGFIGQLRNGFFNELLHRPRARAGVHGSSRTRSSGRWSRSCSFVCSVGNVPLAAVLWSGGIGFAGVIAFIFADLIVLPIVAIYRKYYGNAYAVRIVALMFVTMVIAALIVDGLFSAARADPAPAPDRARDIFGSIEVDYELFTNMLGVAIFAALFCADRAPRRHRPGVRHEGRQGQGPAHGLRRRHPLLLLPTLPARLRGQPREIPRERPDPARRKAHHHGPLRIVPATRRHPAGVNSGATTICPRDVVLNRISFTGW